MRARRAGGDRRAAASSRSRSQLATASSTRRAPRTSIVPAPSLQRDRLGGVPVAGPRVQSDGTTATARCTLISVADAGARRRDRPLPCGAYADAADGFAALRAAAPRTRRCCACTASRWPVPAVPPRRCRCSRAPAGSISRAAGASAYGIALLAPVGRARRAAFRRATMLAPESAALDLFRRLLALTDPQAARAAARRALARAPGMPRPCTSGRAEAAAGNHAGAREALFAATRARLGFADAWMELGLACSTGWVPWATPPRRCTRRCAPTPNMAARRRRWPRSAAARRDRGGADAAARRAGARSRLRRRAAANLANALLLDRDAAEALAVLHGTAPAGRDGAHWRAHRALALLLLDRTEEARAELDAIVAPHDAEILVLWRRIHLAQRDGDSDAAEAMAARMATLAGMLRRRCSNTASSPSSSWPASTTPTTASPRRSRTGIRPRAVGTVATVLAPPCRHRRRHRRVRPRPAAITGRAPTIATRRQVFIVGMRVPAPRLPNRSSRVRLCSAPASARRCMR